jgi:hypothetical protein
MFTSTALAPLDPACQLLDEALACPGRVLEIDTHGIPATTAPAVRPTALSPAMGAVLQALSTRTSRMRLSLTTATAADPDIWRSSPDAIPAMLLIEVPALIEQPAPERVRRDDASDLTPRLCIDGTRRLGVVGIARHFWRRRPEVSGEVPGVDLVLCCGRRLTAISSRTMVRLDDWPDRPQT